MPAPVVTRPVPSTNRPTSAESSWMTVQSEPDQAQDDGNQLQSRSVPPLPLPPHAS